MQGGLVYFKKTFIITYKPLETAFVLWYIDIKVLYVDKGYDKNLTYGYYWLYLI
jgi:hypothetical protein